MDAKLKHLEFVQAVITRLAQNSFVFKGWAVTIATGLSAFAAAETKHAALVIAIASTLIFWGLDAYYLWLEQRFRILYDRVVATPPDETDFSMRIDKGDAAKGWFTTCRRLHLLVFYGTIALIELLGVFVVKGSK